MKKGLIVFAVLIALVAGAAWYFLSGAGELIRTQIEQQGSKYLGTTVTVARVDLALSDGRISIVDLDVANPKGFNSADAFSLDTITLDIGEVTSEPYVIQEVSLNAPEILYEMDADGNGNLLALKDNIMAQLPKTDASPEPQPEGGANPLVIIEKVVVSDVRLKLDFEKVSTGDLQMEKSYEVTLPTFNAGSIGKPNGIPADQAGTAVVNAMLDNVIAAAKKEAKQRLKDEAKKLAEEKLEEQKDKLKDKAKDKRKDRFN